MTRAKLDLDLELSIGGKGALKGALTPEDLADLADLLKGLKAFDPSLENIQMVGSIRKGSAKVSCVAPHPKGLVNVRPPRVAARAYFETGGFDEDLGWTWGRSARYALDRITRRQRTLGIVVPPSHPDEKPLKTKFGRKDFERFNQKIAVEPKWHTIRGTMLELDLKDRTFEIHTGQGLGQITCPFPKDYTNDQILALADRVVSAEVFCRHRPHTGPWKADECKTVLPIPQPEPLIREAYPPGIRPPKRPMVGGFNLQEFAPSLDAAAGESLATFLQDFEGE
jgi:hypothetical protein